MRISDWSSDVCSSDLFAASPALAAEKLSARDQKVYEQAFAAVDEAQWVKAREIAAKAKDPLLAKMIRWLDLTQRGPGCSFAEMQSFLAENPDWPLLGAMRANAERAMPRGRDAAEVIARSEDRRVGNEGVR